ncbi:MAG: 3-deoxy-D-manno-octulosonic acid transferase [Armatimonadota bacterium]|nr:3-deoxy-D-manno-octulosonic acid transferase [Armatimonadota bacterium]
MAEQTPTTAHAGSRAIWVAYNILLVLLLPLVVLYLLWRLVVRSKTLAGFSERMGAIADRIAGLEGDDPVVWVHAVSAGEVAAVVPVIQEIRVADPMAGVALSTITETGREMARKRHVDPDALFYFPFDLPVIVNRVLDAVRPDVMVLVETEIWPNMLQAAASRGVRVIIVNGRVSDHSYARARRLRPLFAWMLSNVEAICAQSQEDADRFIALGADPGRVVVTGNSKFDEQFPTVSEAEANKFRQDFGFGRDDPVLLAASTHEGEEEIALQAFTQLKVTHPDLQLVIAPRHPERGGRVEELVHDHGYAAYRRSRALDAGGTDPLAPEGGAQVRVAILDTMGELARVYAIAAVTFVGKSLAVGGGHNVLQPVALGKPALFGPHMENFRDIAAICLREGVGFEVSGLEELVAEAHRLLTSEGDLTLIAARGPAVIEKYSGASRRCAEHVVSLLEAAVPDRTGVISPGSLEG